MFEFLYKIVIWVKILFVYFVLKIVYIILNLKDIFVVLKFCIRVRGESFVLMCYLVIYIFIY